MSVRLYPVGGWGEFGANCLLVERPDGQRLVFDTGVALGTLEEYGVGFEVPDFSSLGAPAPQLAVLTHAHDDHLKGLPFFADAFPTTPLAASAATWPWIEKLLGQKPAGATLDSQPFALDGVRLEALSASHSVPGTVILRLQLPEATLVLATDFRLAPSALGEETDLATLAAWGQQGVDLLLLDATNALEVETPPSEAAVAATLAELVAQAEGAVVAVSFASHAGRFCQMAAAAQAAGRVVVPLGRGMEEMVALQVEQGLLSLPAGVVRWPRELSRFAHDQLVLVVTGSQGEPAAVFPRLARDELPYFRLAPGDLIIHAARVIPGSERRLDHIFDHCVRRGARVVTAQQAPTHASGHAPVPELAKVLELLRPRWVVPIHGRMRQLAALAELARRQGLSALVAENGQELTFASGRLEASSHIRPVGRILVDVDQEKVDAAVVWERRAAARRGVVVAVLAIPAHPQAPLPNPHIDCFGLRLPGINRAHLAAELGGRLRQEAASLPRDPEKLRATMQQWLASELRKRLGKNPRVVALVVEF